MNENVNALLAHFTGERGVEFPEMDWSYLGDLAEFAREQSEEVEELVEEMESRGRADYEREEW